MQESLHVCAGICTKYKYAQAQFNCYVKHLFSAHIYDDNLP